jgi:hypothetical protein
MMVSKTLRIVVAVILVRAGVSQAHRGLDPGPGAFGGQVRGPAQLRGTCDAWRFYR